MLLELKDLTFVIELTLLIDTELKVFLKKKCLISLEKKHEMGKTQVIRKVKY